MRCGLLVTLLALSAAVAVHGWSAQTAIGAPRADGGRRIALVIGIGNYAQAPLQNAVPDARVAALALEDAGFSVTLLENATGREMSAAIGATGGGITADDIALFFFVGHGVQLEGVNYLIPVDFVSGGPAPLTSMIAASEVHQALAAAKMSLVLLDAARPSSFVPAGGAVGLAPMHPQRSLVAFASQPGTVSSDPPNAKSGLFTQELVNALREPLLDLTVRDVLYRVRQRVYTASNGRTAPAIYDGLNQDLVLRRPHALPTRETTEPPSSSDPRARTEADTQPKGPTAAEIALWNAISMSRRAGDYHVYLQQYPEGVFVALARSRIEEIKSGDAPSLAQAVQAGAVWEGKVVTSRGEAEVSLELEAENKLRWVNTRLLNGKGVLTAGTRAGTWTAVGNQIYIVVPRLNRTFVGSEDCTFEGKLVGRSELVLTAGRGTCSQWSLVLRTSGPQPFVPGP